MYASLRTTLLDIVALTTSPPLGFTSRVPTTELTLPPLPLLRKPAPAPLLRIRLWFASCISISTAAARRGRRLTPTCKHGPPGHCSSDLHTTERSDHVNSLSPTNWLQHDPSPSPAHFQLPSTADTGAETWLSVRKAVVENHQGLRSSLRL